MVNATKVVLTLIDRKATVGIRAEGCDPVLKVITGLGWRELLDLVPTFLAEAEALWGTTPLMPAYQRPPGQALPPQVDRAPYPARAPAVPAGPTQQPLL